MFKKLEKNFILSIENLLLKQRNNDFPYSPEKLLKILKNKNGYDAFMHKIK